MELVAPEAVALAAEANCIRAAWTSDPAFAEAVIERLLEERGIPPEGLVEGTAAIARGVGVDAAATCPDGKPPPSVLETVERLRGH
jgi:hypothetical protein